MAEKLLVNIQNQKILLLIARTKLNLKNDAELSRVMGVNAPLISKLRHGKVQISAALLIEFHEKTGMSIAELKRITGYKGLSESAAEATHVAQASGSEHVSVLS